MTRGGGSTDEEEEELEGEVDAKASVEEEEEGMRRDTARERRQRSRQSSKDTLKQFCAYSGLQVIRRRQKTTEPKARELVRTMYQ